MPVFEFRCRACAEVYEELLAGSDSPAPPCPACNASEPVRLLSRFSTRTPNARRADFSRVPFESAPSCCHRH